MNDELRQKSIDILRNYHGKPLRIMEVCGTHTHEIFRHGLRSLLSPDITLISGPGCPVCVTPVEYIDKAVWLALEKHAAICTFGDLIKVPGTEMSLAGAREKGGNIITVYSQTDAVDYAKAHPEEETVFLSVGFETTTPGACVAVLNAAEQGVHNFSILTANKTMPSAYLALKGMADAFIYPGHVNTITGNAVCKALAAEGISGAVAGFEADELLFALATIVKLCEKGEPFFRNCYSLVNDEGNPAAVRIMNMCMEACDSEWRGLGIIKNSGMRLKPEYSAFDAEKKFNIPPMKGQANPGCRCGEVLSGKCSSTDCPLFGKACTPVHPVGACMVSSEGACAAYYQYGGLL